MDTMMMIWFIVIFGFLVIEIMTPSFVSICFSIAGVVSLILYFLGFGLLGQLVGYAIGLALTLYFILPILQKLARSKSSDGSQAIVRTNLDAIIGEIGICLADISLLNDGLVKIEGKEWTAKVQNDIIIKSGDPIIIKEIQGSKVIVEKVEIDESEE